MNCVAGVHMNVPLKILLSRNFNENQFILWLGFHYGEKYHLDQTVTNLFEIKPEKIVRISYFGN